MQQITLTIGRNVGSGPVADERWARFIDDTLALVRRHSFDVVVQNTGRGEWQGADGEVIREENFHVAGIREDDVNETDTADSVRREVRELAHVYGQEAIALGFGTSELVSGA